MENAGIHESCPVMTRSGPRPAGTISASDYLLSSSGRFAQPLKVKTRRQKHDEPLLLMKAKGDLPGVMSAHQLVWSAPGILSGTSHRRNRQHKPNENKFSFVYAHEARGNELPFRRYCLRPLIQTGPTSATIDLASYVEDHLNGGRAWKIYPNEIQSCRKPKIQRFLPWDEDLGLFFGLFLADGCSSISRYSLKGRNTAITRSSVVFCLGESKLGVKDFVQSQAQRLFGSVVRHKKGRGKSTISSFSSGPGARFLHSCYGPTKEKIVPDFAMGLPPLIASSIVRGWLLGDGNQSTRGAIIGGSVSCDLIYRMRGLLEQNSILASIHTYKQSQTSQGYKSTKPFFVLQVDRMSSSKLIPNPNYMEKQRWPMLARRTGRAPNTSSVIIRSGVAVRLAPQTRITKPGNMVTIEMPDRHSFVAAGILTR